MSNKIKYTIFQWLMILSMFIGTLLSNKNAVLLSLSAFLIGFIEPKYEGHKKNE